MSEAESYAWAIAIYDHEEELRGYHRILGPTRELYIQKDSADSVAEQLSKDYMRYGFDVVRVKITIERVSDE